MIDEEDLDEDLDEDAAEEKSLPLAFKSGSVNHYLRFAKNSEGIRSERFVEFVSAARRGREDHVKPIFPVRDLMVVFNKLLNTTVTPKQIKLPVRCSKGRRPERGSKIDWHAFEAMASNRRMVEAYAEQHGLKAPVEPTRSLSSGGAIRVANARCALTVSYDRSTDLLSFDLDPIPVDLLFAALPHILSDELAKEADWRYFYPWLMRSHANLWGREAPGEIPDMVTVPPSVAVRHPPAPAPLKKAAVVDPPNEDRSFVLGALFLLAERLTGADAEVDESLSTLYGVLSDVSWRIQRLLISRSVEPAKIGKGPSSIEEIPDDLKAPFRLELERLLEERIAELRAREEALASKERELNSAEAKMAEERKTLDAKEAAAIQALTDFEESGRRDNDAVKAELERIRAQMAKGNLILVAQALTKLGKLGDNLTPEQLKAKQDYNRALSALKGIAS